MPVGLSTMKKMMKNKIYVILCLLTLGLFVLIFIQERSHFIKLQPLNGVYYEAGVYVLKMGGHSQRIVRY